MIENAVGVLGNVHIGQAVAIVVADSNAHTISSAGDAGFSRDVSEGAVVIVPVESVVQRPRRMIEVAWAAVDEIDIHPAIVIEIKKGTSCADGFGQIHLRRKTAVWDQANPLDDAGTSSNNAGRLCDGTRRGPGECAGSRGFQRSRSDSGKKGPPREGTAAEFRDGLISAVP